MGKLAQSFYEHPDVVDLARRLVGKHLFTRLPVADAGSRRILTGGIIVETEAYAGPEDRASHAYANRRTKRTEIMYHPGGVAYVYLCYGIHSLFNVITNIRGIPHAILVRAIEPTHGLSAMLTRRGKTTATPPLTAGPGALSQALGIDIRHNGMDLTGARIWIEAREPDVPEAAITVGPRVGIGYAGRDSRRPWRFRLRNSPWTSPAR